MSISISLATREDSDQIIKLLKDTANWLQENNIDQWSYLRNGEEDNELRLAIQQQKTYIATYNDKLVGTFTLYDSPNDWDKYIWGTMPPDALYLHRLATVRDQQNKGVGRMMIDWIEREYKRGDKKYIRLDCVSANEALNKYYRDAGFTFLGIHHDQCKYEKGFEHND
ncbi:GNAT family N-acetyltransferase [Bacillus horti]|uniref:Ribosomal protein S18 acetylase RimI-like enzyme n=1 Tax=Caldalkalibacillus horti TaxID=77523 RepID=A0ABT9VXJ5_9BACI|nr:GNAT family N-acetyltransferase [Bacillus horti]MDQ0165712.1 ribosomal protein S18 acetylase RimI-like enzyme [Bacillus horti]